METAAVILLSGAIALAAVAVMAWRRRVRAARTVRRVRRAAAVDGATGLPNRHGFVDRTRRLRTRGDGRTLLIAVIDHAPHDDAIAALAARTATLLPRGAIVARIDPPMLACAVALDRYAADAADQMAARLAALTDSAGTAIGLARSDRDGDRVEQLIEAATVAAAAARGRDDRLAWFAPGMGAARRARDGIAHGLPDAIARGAIMPYFEPLIELATGRLLGFEVLARWHHPVHGVISPAQFIDVAEESGAIADLDLSVMRQAMVAARDWDGALALSVNLSVTGLRDPWLAQKLIRLLAETGFPARRLEVELTEEALFDPAGVAVSIVESLKPQGVRVALDDFGTGVSSLSHLRSLPLDRIKIAQSIVTGLIVDPARESVARGIVQLGAGMGVPVTAEGVESARIAERLREMGCLTGQGHFLGMPASLMQTRRMLAEQRMIARAG